jgi:DNA excision repair protein ERCC-2
MQVLNHANIVVYNYQYMLDPKVSNLVSRELEAESIVVFDEAHNIDNVCIEALSVTLDQRMMASASRSVNRLQSRVAEMKASDSQRLAREYQALVAGLTEQGVLGAPSGSGNDSSNGGGFLLEDSNTMGNPLLPDDIMQEAVPGNIRKAEHFVTFLKKIVEYFKKRLKGSSVEKEFPEGFMHDMYVKTALEKKALKFTYSRLNSLLRTLEITSLEEFTPLQEVANFATLVSTYTTGFSVITEPLGSVIAGVQEPLLQLCCLDASLAIQPVFKRFSSVVITSGTLSPIELYPKLLNFYPVVRASLPMSTFRPCLLPLVVTRGSDQIPLSTKFDQRKDPSVVRNYGDLLLQVVRNTPDGVCCFFTSYSFMEDIISQWDQLRILQKVMDHKLVFLETKDVVETTLALDNFKRACDSGRSVTMYCIYVVYFI